MGCSCCDFRDAADRQFTAAKAAKELQVYRKGRLGPTTRRLRDVVIELGLNQGSLLDIGGGVGALTFELLDRGMATAVMAEASKAYATTAKEETARRGVSAKIVHGDLLELSKELPAADLVTLDRVVCCYPSYVPMLEDAARHAKRGLALSYPRDRWFVRAGMWLENAKRARKSGFRTFVHPPVHMRQVIERAGFELTRRSTTPMWAIDIYLRRDAETSHGRAGRPLVESLW